MCLVLLLVIQCCFCVLLICFVGSSCYFVVARVCFLIGCFGVISLLFCLIVISCLLMIVWVFLFVCCFGLWLCLHVGVLWFVCRLPYLICGLSVLLFYVLVIYVVITLLLWLFCGVVTCVVLFGFQWFCLSFCYFDQVCMIVSGDLLIVLRWFLVVGQMCDVYLVSYDYIARVVILFCFRCSDVDCLSWCCLFSLFWVSYFGLLYCFWLFQWF